MRDAVVSLTVLSVLLASTATCAAREIPTGFLTKTVKASGIEVKYVVHVPPSYQPHTPMPTIIFLNGSGECGTDGLLQIACGLGPAVMRHVDKWPFIVIFPQKQVEPDKWAEEDPMVMAILQKTQREYNVEQTRLYLTGLSQGGFGTWAIAALHPDLFAAIAPICGGGTEEAGQGAVADIPRRSRRVCECILCERYGEMAKSGGSRLYADGLSGHGAQRVGQGVSGRRAKRLVPEVPKIECS